MTRYQDKLVVCDANGEPLAIGDKVYYKKLPVLHEVIGTYQDIDTDGLNIQLKDSEGHVFWASEMDVKVDEN